MSGRITGPNGPFTNIPPTLETQVEFIRDTIKRAEEEAGREKTSDQADGTDGDAPVPSPIVEATKKAEDDWTSLCKQLSDNSLFKKTDSW